MLTQVGWTWPMTPVHQAVQVGQVDQGLEERSMGEARYLRLKQRAEKAPDSKGARLEWDLAPWRVVRLMVGLAA